MVHAASGIPVDLFSTTVKAWWNYVVCRTGPKDHNVMIAERARGLGYAWHPYHSGFERLSDRAIIPMETEQSVFKLMGLQYKEPWER